jgi:hypothetical protein
LHRDLASIDVARTDYRMLKTAVSKAAGESKPEAYPLGYVEDFDELRTKLADFFSILLEGKGQLNRLRRTLRERYSRAGSTFGIGRNAAD